MLNAELSNHNSSSYANDEDRRKALAEFLRTRRERLKPIPGRVAQLSRRRTPGLRREEVAELAGVGATWYTWLEQARDIQPSSDVLEKVGRALELNPFEMRHLFKLAGKLVPDTAQITNQVMPDALKRFIDNAVTIPTVVFGERMDVLYFNSLWADQIAPFYAAYAERGGSNWVEYLFMETRVKEILTDWEGNSKRIIAEFRASVADKVGSPWVSELVEKLKIQSPDFNQYWKDHDVRERVSLSLEINHPKYGHMEFERTVYCPVDAPKIKVIMFNPVSR